MAGQTNGKSAEPFFVKHNYIFVQLVEIKICFDVTSHFIFIPKYLTETALSQLWNGLNSCLKMSIFWIFWSSARWRSSHSRIHRMNGLRVTTRVHQIQATFQKTRNYKTVISGTQREWHFGNYNERLTISVQYVPDCLCLVSKKMVN